MGNFRIRNMQELERHSRKLRDHFFTAGTNATLHTVSVAGIYRQPYQALTEGYVVTVNRLEDSEPYAFVYRFEAEEGALLWFPIGRQESLASAEAYLKSMGATK